MGHKRERLIKRMMKNNDTQTLGSLEGLQWRVTGQSWLGQCGRR